MTELLIELWPIDRPKPYARNARKISDKAVEKVAASIREFGFRQPIVVDTDGTIIVGHARLLAAKALGHTEVPVHVASSLTPAQVKAYRLADNRTNEETSWDFPMLKTELADLRSLDLDLSLTGFDPTELSLEGLEQPRDDKGRWSTKKTTEASGALGEPVPSNIGIEFPEATMFLDAAAIASWQIHGTLDVSEPLKVLYEQFPSMLLGGCRLCLSIEPLE